MPSNSTTHRCRVRSNSLFCLKLAAAWLHHRCRGGGIYPLLIMAFMSTAVAAASLSVITISDFEGGSEGWVVDSPSSIYFKRSSALVHTGNSSICLNMLFSSHRSVRCVKTFVPPLSFDTNVLVAISGWIFIQGGTDQWRIELGTFSGIDWSWAQGFVQEGAESGWHRFYVKATDIADPSTIHKMQIIVQNQGESTEAVVCLDSIQALTVERDELRETGGTT